MSSTIKLLWSYGILKVKCDLWSSKVQRNSWKAWNRTPLKIADCILFVLFLSGFFPALPHSLQNIAVSMSICAVHRFRSSCKSVSILIWTIVECRSIQFYPLRKHAYSNKLKTSPPNTENFQIKNSSSFHISAQNIDCGYSLEPPRRGGSNEYPLSIFSRN